MTSSPTSPNNPDALDNKIVSVRGQCDKHGLWSREVPKHMAPRVKGKCPDCEQPGLQPLRFQTVKLTGNCDKHGGAWEREVPSMLADRVRGRCPKCDAEADEARQQAEMASKAQAAQGKKAKHIARVVDGAGIPRRFRDRSFENYRAAGPEQEKALELARRFATGFPKVVELGASLIFCGKPGTGKTHLACAIANHVMREYGNSALFLTVFDAIQRIKETYGNAELTEKQVMDALCAVDLLILDEVGVQFGTQYEEVVITQIINRRYSDMRPTIILSNLDQEGLAGFLGQRVVDRVDEGGGGIVAFTWDSYRKRVLKDEALPRGEYKPLSVMAAE